MSNDNRSSAPYRIMGRYEGKPIFLYTFPSHVDIRIGTERYIFRNYEESITFLQALVKRKRVITNANNNKGK